MKRASLNMAWGTVIIAATACSAAREHESSLILEAEGVAETAAREDSRGGAAAPIGEPERDLREVADLGVLRARLVDAGDAGADADIP